MRLIENPRYVKFSTIASVLSWSYFIVVNHFEETRVADGTLSANEIQWWEWGPFLALFVFTFSLYFSALFHASEHKKFGWGIAVLFFWPLAFVYGWVHMKNES